MTEVRIVQVKTTDELDIEIRHNAGGVSIELGQYGVSVTVTEADWEYINSLLKMVRV